MGILAAGGVLAALATAWMGTRPTAGIVLAVLAFCLIGTGVGASGTSLLALLAKQVAPERRAAAGSIVWVMMILGFILTAGIAGHYLDPFSPERLVLVTATVAAIAFVLTLCAVAGVERSHAPKFAPELPVGSPPPAPNLGFRAALAEVWAEPRARHFTLFVFVAMLAYSTQDLILEPFAGTVFGMTPGESTQLSGVQNTGVLLGMLLVAVGGSALRRRRVGSLRLWTAGGCIASAAALAGLAAGGLSGPGWPLPLSVFLLGLANGTFAVAAIGSMMALAGAGIANREGVRMGLWGAAQAIAFALGGFLGTAAIDVMRAVLGDPALAYCTVFVIEAVVFLAAGRMALGIEQPEEASTSAAASPPSGEAQWRATS
jgi:BCD family chlorophyll transporter-like MFS transporter